MVKPEASRGAMDVRKSVATPESFPRSDNICVMGGKTKSQVISQGRIDKSCIPFTYTSHDLVSQTFDSYALKIDIHMLMRPSSRDCRESQ